MKYTPPIGGAADDPYVDGDPSSGIDGSPVSAAAIESPQREIMSVISFAGLEGEAADLTQLCQAIIKMIAAGQSSQNGQCRLTKSGSSLLLSPRNGNKLIINGATREVPSSGVILAPAGMTVGTLYFIYAYMNDDVLVLEASTTGHSTDAATGVEIKTGDPSRSLVGMARPIAGPAWVDSDNQRFVLSWFNRQPLPMQASFSANRSTSSTSFVALSTEIRLEFLSWGGNASSIALTGSMSNSISEESYTAIAVDSTTAAIDSVSSVHASSNSSFFYPFSGAFADDFAEGYHYATLIGKVGSGTGTWRGGAAGGRSSAIGIIWG